MENNTKTAKSRFLKILLLILVFLLLSSAWTAYRYQKIIIEKKSNNLALKQVQSNLAKLEQKLLRKEFKRLIADAFIIKGAVEEEIKANDYTAIEKRFINIIKNKRIYAQIRYIDEKGNEVVRVDLKNKKLITYKKYELQNKADRYYFKETMQIKKGEVYVSKLDLNIEHGEIEQPLKPMIRIATKVYDKDGNDKGIIITNYYAKIMLDDFVDFAKNSVGNVYLLNSKSYWLSNKQNKNFEFAFMYKDKLDLNFKNAYPQAYEEIFVKNLDSFETKRDLFFAEKVIPFKDVKGDDFVIPVKKIVLGDGNLMVVLHVEKEKMGDIYIGSVFRTVSGILYQDIFIFLVLFALAALLSIFLNLYNEHKKNLKFYAEIDQSTEVFNRHAGLKKMNQLIARTRASASSVGIIFVDVNGLKTVNDALGHQYGDELIKMAARIMKDSIRSNDILFRYGGDEFVMCLEKINNEGIEIIWRRILTKIDCINENKDSKYNISLSHGVSIIPADEKNVNIAEYIEKADQKMYKEKDAIKQSAVIIKE